MININSTGAVFDNKNGITVTVQNDTQKDQHKSSRTAKIRPISYTTKLVLDKLHQDLDNKQTQTLFTKKTHCYGNSGIYSTKYNESYLLHTRIRSPE